MLFNRAIVRLLWTGGVALSLPRFARSGTTEDWPAFTRNVCKNPGKDIFIDFEEGLDGIQVAKTYPEVKFTNTLGLDWVYLDVRTNQYNANGYNDDTYAVNGNKGTWLGVSGNTGRIDFTGSLASYFSLIASCGSSGISIEAYNADGVLLDSAAAGENIWSDKDNPRPPVARLTVEDTTQGGNISYIEVSDSGNFWVVDDICTDAKSPCTPVDGFVKGPSSKRIDIVFLKDAQYTGTDADYESVVKSMINDRLFAHEPIKSKKSSFNFYISKKLIGDSKSPGPPTCGPATLPANFYSLCPYADAVAVLHSLTYGDCCASGVFSTEANIDRSFIHEVGHAALGLHDQYDDAPGCRTYRPPKSYNTYINKTECENDATAHGFDATKCYQFTTCPAGPGVRWELDEGKEFIMDDGLHHANGWSSSSEWRIGEYLDNLALGLGKPDGALEPASETRSMLMELEISDSGITLREDPRVVVSAAPQYLVPPYEYSVIILNNAGGLLGAFGFEDPRKIYAESDYSGPVTTGTVANKTLIVPYFSTADTSVVSNGEQTLNIDVSPLAGLPAGTLRADAGGPYEGEVGDLIIFNASQSEASTSNISVYEWDIGGTGVADIVTANETVEYKANAALDVNLVLTVKTVDDATAQDQTLLKITPAPINNPCDANNCELLFSKGKTMTKTRRIFNRCVDRCVRLRLVRLYQAFGWECGTCEEDEEEE